MCGIFAAINCDSVTSSLMDGLQALSYRGYDSAGIAVIGSQGLERRRAEGKLDNLSKVLENTPLDGAVGIAHTRWATHGSPTERNAHPHMTSRVAIAHNGIIENYQILREQLENEGYVFMSETDSETIPLLITRALDMGMNPTEAMRATLDDLEGSFAIAAVFNDQPDMMFAARHGSPLVIGQNAGGFYIASDSNALAEKVNTICHLKDGDLACISRENLTITNRTGHPAQRCMQNIESSIQQNGKNGFRHYMLKEMHEQPAILKHIFNTYVDSNTRQVRLSRLPFKTNRIQRLSIIACGTSYYAGMIAKYWLESLSALPVDLDIASEYRYRNAPLSRMDGALFISQSGETADTLAALRHAKKAGQHCLSIVNVKSSNMAYESDAILETLAGSEIGVASTKAFTAQLSVLLMLSLTAARCNCQINADQEQHLIDQVYKLPSLLQRILDDQEGIKKIAATLQHASNLLYLGRGTAYPLALEGALKIKEISYIHAEAYPAGELKHGPIALIDEHMPVVMIALPGPMFKKSLSNLREVSTRGAKVILISDEYGVNQAREFIHDAIVMPNVEELLQPILYSLPLQLLAYHVAVLKGTDIDQPRNLAKSVTVE